VHAFPFSPRPGTPAARMPQIERGVVKARAERLRAAGSEAMDRWLERQIGREVLAVVERPGRARAPDFTEIAFEGEAASGSLARIAIHGQTDGRALGRLV